LGSRLSSSFGVVIQDATVDGVFYEKCFIGRDCVDWIYENLRLEQRYEALKIAFHLILGGLIVGISTTDHLDVDSDKALYRFNYEKINQWYDGYQRTHKNSASFINLSDTNITEEAIVAVKKEEEVVRNSK
jgi:hypothetical protein